MKTAVSIPGPLFEAADRLAHRRRVSRSALYAEALHLLLAGEDDADAAITAQLDAVLGDAHAGRKASEDIPAIRCSPRRTPHCGTRSGDRAR